MTPTTEPTRPHLSLRDVVSDALRNLGYLLGGFPVALTAWTVVVCVGLFALGTLPIWIGVPLGAGTLYLARAFAVVERSRLRAARAADLRAVYAEPAATSGHSRVTRLLSTFKDGQLWKDVAHACVAMPLALATWSVALIWSVLAVFGTTTLAWAWALPDDQQTSEEGVLGLLNSPGGQTVVGLFALVTLPWVLKGLMLPHVALGRLLLSSSEAAALRAEVARLDTARSAAASAESASLRRIERDLHDGPQQRLIRLAMDVQSAERAMDTDPAAAREALASARQQSAEALAELRALTRGIAPPLLAERGLAAAIDSLAALSTVPVTVAVTLDEPVSLGAETAAYFVVSESLANLAKHADATQATVTVKVADGSLLVVVTDDGRGGAHVAKGRGLAGLADRVAGVGGSLAVVDAPQGGTIVTAEIPCG